MISVGNSNPSNAHCVCKCFAVSARSHTHIQSDIPSEECALEINRAYCVWFIIILIATVSQPVKRFVQKDWRVSKIFTQHEWCLAWCSMTNPSNIDHTISSLAWIAFHNAQYCRFQMHFSIFPISLHFLCLVWFLYCFFFYFF